MVPGRCPGRDRQVDGADSLRHFSQANISCLAPVGSGLALTAEPFNSFIGCRSFSAKNNLNYARSYLADHAPYFMFGLGATYPVNDALRAGLYVING